MRLVAEKIDENVQQSSAILENSSYANLCLDTLRDVIRWVQRKVQYKYDLYHLDCSNIIVSKNIDTRQSI